MPRLTRRPRQIAIIGAGPIGLEAALYARALGHRPTVYERGDVGEHVRRWGFVELFSPWSLNVSSLGVKTLRSTGVDLPPMDRFASGNEFRERYLLPLAAELEAHVRPRHDVIGVTRDALLKGDAIGDARRAERSFRLLLRDGDGGETSARAEVVLDASGVYGQPGALGSGGLPAPGEREAAGRIDRHLPDLLGADVDRYRDRKVLLVGSGYSASTALAALRELSSRSRTRVIWARRDRREAPFRVIADDPLPARSLLGREGNALAASPPPGFEVISGVVVERLEPVPDGLRVDLAPAFDAGGGSGPSSVVVDRVVALVGYRPDLQLCRELQVHVCYATEGPMKLAAALLGAGAGGDCLAQVGFGPESLLSPEPDFFLLGHKSYGRRSDFLMRTGREQIRDIFRLLEDDPVLSLYEEDA